MPPAVEVWSLNHWTTGQRPGILLHFILIYLCANSFDCTSWGMQGSSIFVVARELLIAACGI